MRVVAGQFKGRQLVAPAGMATRPTTARNRESWASSIGSLSRGFADARVLDPFAGSGALGIEALSRGAGFILFVDRNPKAIHAIKDNLDALGAVDTAQVLRADALAPPTLPRLKEHGPYDLIFLDPPYAVDAEKISNFLDELENLGTLAADCLISYEQDKSAAQITLPPNFQVLRSKDFSTTRISYIEYRGSHPGCPREKGEPR